MTTALPSTSLPILDLRHEANKAQRRASDPENIVWVGASAGSGKTTVLTSRVLRLLLPDPRGRWKGTPPHRILCMTFTKAAAAEMKLRLARRLREWAVMPEDDLRADLENLTGESSSEEMVMAARRLFSKVLEAESGLLIVTLHSFCESVLGRFPLESGTTPGFSVVEEQMAEDLLKDSLNHFLKIGILKANPQLREALARLAACGALRDVRKTILKVLGSRRDLEKTCARYAEYGTLLAAFQDRLGIREGEEELRRRFCAEIPGEKLGRMIAALESGKRKTEENAAKSLRAWLCHPPEKRTEKLEEYSLIFLTKKGEIRKLPVPRQGEEWGGVFWAEEGERIKAYEEDARRIRTVRQTADLVWVSLHVVREYEERKRRKNALDFGDLIEKTRALLEKESAAWVHYKLDGGIDHILVDEAQDTNLDQWEIVKALSVPFFEGAGRETEKPRSLFVVGDEKQSIFGFQGAAPQAFDTMRTFFEKRAAESDRVFDRVSLDISFRTTPPILKVVDRVFADPDLRRSLGTSLGSGPLVHYPSRKGEAGLVALSPPLLPPDGGDGEKHKGAEKKEEKEPRWSLPFSKTGDQEERESGSPSLASAVAQKIWGLVRKKENLESEGRPIEAGDILVLVRTRGSFVAELIRQLKQRGVPVSGIDRMKLSDSIAVQDCLALARFARLPEDDMNLAILLKSPFLRLGEEEVMALALDRSASLWAEVQRRNLHLARWLSGVIKRGSVQLPFDFFDESLNAACPGSAEGGSGWKAFATHLGPDALDPLGELLSLCLAYEAEGVRALEEFLVRQSGNAAEIKREMEEAGGKVRIMTVHASKGLEAPIVILPDTVSLPSRNKLDRFFPSAKTGFGMPLWAARAADESRETRKLRDAAWEEGYAEYGRLLYVALTRARDRLYLMGKAPIKGKIPEQSWYAHLKKAFEELSADAQRQEDGTLILRTNQVVPPRFGRGRERPGPTAPAPAWLWTKPEGREETPRLLYPSRPEEAEAVSSPLGSAAGERYRRGTLTHRLLQFLPDMPAEKWKKAGKDF